MPCARCSSRCPVRRSGSLEEEIWPLIPPDQLGKPLSKAEREQILGFGENGV